MPDPEPISTKRNFLISHLWRDHAVRSSFFSFTLTRLLILFVVLVSANMRFEPPVRDQFGDIHESSSALNNTNVAELFTRLTSGADSLWILNIARNGYEKEPFNTNLQHTWAYFPLYPLILRAVGSVTGNLPLTGIVLSSVMLLAALILLYRTVIAFGYDSSVADRTVFYIAAFPVSYFFSLSQTESLFLLLTVGCFYAARRKHWLLAGVCGALASATRFAGVFLVVPLAILYWQSSAGAGRRIRANLLSLLLVPTGLLGFMLYLRSITGNAFAFSDIQVAWGHNAGVFWRPLSWYLTDPQQLVWKWDFRLLNFAAAVTALAAGLILIRRREWAFGAYALISILIPLSYQTSLQSMARYVMAIFPVFIVLATFGSSRRVDQVIRVVFIALLSLMSAMLAMRVTFALS